MCGDRTCTDGLRRCDGCNGWGVVTMAGRRYRLRSGARNIPTSTTARDHGPCNGSGLVVCGCTPVDSTALEMVGASA